MTQVRAIYRQGVFQPLDAVDLSEEQPVLLLVEPTAKPSPQEWLAETRRHREAMRARVGTLPDSTELIAADRLR